MKVRLRINIKLLLTLLKYIMNTVMLIGYNYPYNESVLTHFTVLVICFRAAIFLIKYIAVIPRIDFCMNDITDEKQYYRIF